MIMINMCSTTFLESYFIVYVVCTCMWWWMNDLWQFLKPLCNQVFYMWLLLFILISHEVSFYKVSFPQQFHDQNTNTSRWSAINNYYGKQHYILSWYTYRTHIHGYHCKMHGNDTFCETCCPFIDWGTKQKHMCH